MEKKTVKFTHGGAEQIPNNRPVVYKIQTEGGKTNYVGVAKRGRAGERIKEHLNAGEITGHKVQIEQMSSIEEAKEKEKRIISRSKPKYNEQGK